MGNIRWLRMGVVVGALAVLGCAQATIRKIPNRSDYPDWSKDDQKRADSMCGLRFYRTRPYVVVKKPFVVHSETVLVDAVTSEDGRHVRLIGETLRDKAGKSLHLKADGVKLAAELRAAGLMSGAIPYASVVRSSPTSTNGNVPIAQSATETGVVSPGTLPTIAPHATAADRPSGRQEIQLSTNLKGIGHKVLTPYLDLVYLPDFEEQYVINPTANLGGVSVGFTQGPGGELLAMGMSVDNSALTRPLVDAWTDFVKNASTAVQSEIGIAQSATEADGSKRAPMTTPDKLITVRVHVVKMANIGLHPILKASEMLENRNCVRELGKCNCTACVATMAGGGEYGLHMMPLYPYSRVAYQTHSSIVVEDLITQETVRGMPGFAQAAGDPTPRGGGITDAQLLTLMKTVLGRDGTTRCCADVEIVSRVPPSGSAITSIKVRLASTREDGTANPDGTVTQDCRDTAMVVLKRDLPVLKDAQIEIE